MTSLSNLKLTLDSNRKLLSVECDDFRVKLNGMSNVEYTTLFKAFGITLDVKAVVPDLKDLAPPNAFEPNVIAVRGVLTNGTTLD